MEPVITFRPGTPQDWIDRYMAKRFPKGEPETTPPKVDKTTKKGRRGAK